MGYVPGFQHDVFVSAKPPRQVRASADANA